MIEHIPDVQALPLPRENKMKLDRDLEAMIGDTGLGVPGLGVIVFKNRQIIYRKFLGRRYIDPIDPARDLPLTGDTRFRIASVSKQFTALTILQLSGTGKLSLDEDISQYLGFVLRNPHFRQHRITVRMLLSHTSSLRDGTLYAIPPEDSVRELFLPDGKYYNGGEHFAGKNEPPGVYFTYSNLNYGLLGTIIETVTGERFDIYQRNHILQALDISGSYHVSDFDANGMKRLGTIYQKQQHGVWNEAGDWHPQIDDYRGIVQDADAVRICNPDQRQTDSVYPLAAYKTGTNGTIFSPQGGLRISADELAHVMGMYFCDGLYNGRKIVSRELLAEMFRPCWRYDRRHPNGNTYGGTLESYGLGIYMMPGTGMSRAVPDVEMDLAGHTGEAYGLLSALLMMPGTGNGFLYIMNGEAIAEEDPRAQGLYSSNYRWQERVMTAVIRHIFLE